MNSLNPSISVIVKLGSIAVHAEEMLSAKGHEFDMSTLESLLADPEIKEWIGEMNKMALLPVKR